MHYLPHSRALLSLLAAGLLASGTLTPAVAAPPQHHQPARLSALCRWASQLPTWLTNPLAAVQGPPPTPQPTPTLPPNSPVQYAPLPNQADQVLVDQPTGTVFALSDNGLLQAGIVSAAANNSGLLSVLAGATGRPVPWFPTTPPPGAATYLLGSVVPLADGHGQVYFTCGGALYQLAADAQPEPAAVSALPVSPPYRWPVAVDEPAHRLFTLAAGALQAFDTRTGRRLFGRPFASLFGTADFLVGPLAVDSQAGRIYVSAVHYVPPPASPGPAPIDILTERGTLLEKLAGMPAAQLDLAGTTRRLLVFGCGSGYGGAIPAEYVQVLNLTTGRYLTPAPLELGACGGSQTGSLLNADTMGIVAVDAAAGTAVVISATWAPMNPPTPPYPGFAWFINLRTGTRLAMGVAYSCVQVGRQPSAMAIDSHLHRAYVASSADGLVTILDTRTGHVLGVVQVGGVPTSIAVDTHDHRVVVALEGNIDGADSGMPGGVAFFPADIIPAQVPPTKWCAQEGGPFFLGGYPIVPVP